MNKSSPNQEIYYHMDMTTKMDMMEKKFPTHYGNLPSKEGSTDQLLSRKKPWIAYIGRSLFHGTIDFNFK